MDHPRYTIRERLGQGGMGSVYLAYDAGMGRDVALKTVHQFGRTRFPNEVAAGRLVHPHICGIYDVGEAEFRTPDGMEDRRSFLTMPYISGGTLAMRLAERGVLWPTEAVSLTIKIARALGHAHECGVLHRDVKPSNILLDKYGEPFVSDFGLAHLKNPNGDDRTQTGVPLGTDAYMPPEQWSYDRKRMGPTCDVFSLGVTLYQLLTLRLPYGMRCLEIAANLADEDWMPRPPSASRPGLDQALDRIIFRAIARNPSERYQSMRQFAGALILWRPPTPRRIA